MPDRGVTRPASNETRIGSRRAGAGNGVLMLDAPSSSGSILALQDTAGVTWYFWADTSGNLRRASAIPANLNTGGTVVGP